MHKTANVPAEIRGEEGKADLHDIYQAARRRGRVRSLPGQGPGAIRQSHPLPGRDPLLAFYDMPAEPWKHVRGTNVVESTVATVRLRTAKTKGCLSRETALAMVLELARSAERHWRRLNRPDRLAEIIRGVRFRDGAPLHDAEDQAAA